jgi:hypothetical protein
MPASSAGIKEPAHREVLNEHIIAMRLVFFLLYFLPTPQVAEENHQRGAREII